MSKEKVLWRQTFESQIEQVSAGKMHGDHPDSGDALHIECTAEACERFRYGVGGVLQKHRRNNACMLRVPLIDDAGSGEDLTREVRLADVVRVTVEVVNLESYEAKKKEEAA